MGYVSESSATSPVSVPTHWVRDDGFNSGSSTFNSFPTSTRTQFGFRSGALQGAELASIQRLDRVGTWGRQATMLEALDRIQQATSSSGVGRREETLKVHNRDYNVISRPVTSTSGVTGPINGHTLTVNGAAQITSITTGVRLSPLSTSTAEANAGKMMRRYRPTKPVFDLTRFIGELKDTPSLFTRGNYIPGSPFDVGGGYLNYQFGISPSISDIQKGAEAIVKSHDIVTNFVRESARRVHRQGSITLSDTTISGESNTHAGAQSLTVGPFIVSQALGAPSATFGGPRYRYYLNIRRVQRMFSTFEYFVGDPDGYTTRMDDYLSKAKKVLGGGATLPVAYQLTPFSWMLDWFYDIGGLLSYQQDVADNGIVQIRGGYVIEDQYHGSVGMFSRPGFYSGGGTMLYTERVQTRSAGSPYSMSPTWSMDPYKWAIVGALGLLKAKGLAPS